jgi:hypothetical protein
MPTCKGCRHLFTKNGYPRHLAQSQNPACVSIYEEMQNYVPTNENDHSQHASPSRTGSDVHAPAVYERDETDNINIEENLPANIFEGDYLHTKPEDLEWPADEEAEAEGDIESEEDEVEAEGAVAEQERDWEPPIEPNDHHMPMEEDDTHIADAPSNHHETQLEHRVHRHEAEEPLHHQPHVVKFPLQSAGATVMVEESDSDMDSDSRPNGYHHYRQQLKDSNDGMWAPFTSKIDYEVAHWAKTRGPGSTSFSDLLEIEGVSRLQDQNIKDTHHKHWQVCDKLGLSYRNSRELNKIIDTQIPARRPQFQRKEILVAGEAFDVYCRDIIECVRALYGDPEFAPYLVFQPERHYTDQDKTERLYHDLHTGQWWWQTQVRTHEDDHCLCLADLESMNRNTLRKRSLEPLSY